MTARVFAIGTSLDIESGDKAYGLIDERVLSWGRKFEIKDPKGNVVGTAQAKVLVWGTEIEVKDEDGVLIGTIKENIWESLFKITTQYEILDGRGRKIAESTKEDWLETSMEFTANNGQKVMEINRGFWHLVDTWDVQLYNKELIDVRVMIVCAAYKTAVDADRAAESSSSDD